MAKFQRLELENGAIIYLEASDREEEPSVKPGNTSPTTERELTREDLGKDDMVFEGLAYTFPRSIDTPPDTSDDRARALSVEETICQYVDFVLNAFQKVAHANVDKVKLEFGVEVGGGVGIPYIANSTAKGNIKVSVECSFPDRQKPKS